ncbi:MAG: hypothetical protein GXO32_03850 [Crenarchaeota archaeon]|nr:hypothetical protein [Thermoproteota archaeon]
MDPGECLTLLASCLAMGIALEPLPPKPGCVSRYRDFEDKKLSDFVVCSHLATPFLRSAIIDGVRGEPRVGLRIREIVESCIRVTGRNVCLGSSILIASIATGLGTYISTKPTDLDVHSILRFARGAVYSSSVEDSIELYRAIRLASPSYVKPSDRVGAPNVWSSAFEEELRRGGWTLARVLEDAASRDLVAREVIEGFPRTMRALEVIESSPSVEEGCVRAFIDALSRDVDTVVARKRGTDLAKRIQLIAMKVARGEASAEELDRLLVEERVTPGSVADIVAAASSLWALRRIWEAYQDRIKLCIMKILDRC